MQPTNAGAIMAGEERWLDSPSGWISDSVLLVNDWNVQSTMGNQKNKRKSKFKKKLSVDVVPLDDDEYSPLPVSGAAIVTPTAEDIVTPTVEDKDEISPAVPRVQEEEVMDCLFNYFSAIQEIFSVLLAETP